MVFDVGIPIRPQCVDTALVDAFEEEDLDFALIEGGFVHEEGLKIQCRTCYLSPMSISETLLPEFDQEMQNTRKLLECVPEDKPDYKPHDKSMTLARLAGHVAELPGWAVNTVHTSELDLTPASGE